MRNFLKTFRKALLSWHAHEPFMQSAAIAYFAVFSLPALLVILLAIGAFFFAHEQVEHEILSFFEQYLGDQAARNISAIVEDTRKEQRGLWAMAIGILTLLFAATGLFVQLQKIFNNIWEVETKKSAAVVKFLKARLTALGVILAIGFLLLVSLTIQMGLNFLSKWLFTMLPDFFVYGLYVVNFTLSFGITIFIFAVIYKVLPDSQVEWKYAAMGGLLSAVLFLIGEYLITYYFNTARPQSAFGAAGSVILLMLWVSYSCLILLLGAEFTKAVAEDMTGHKAKPTSIAKRQKKGH